MARVPSLVLVLLALAAGPAQAQTAWRATGSMITGRADHTATPLRDGSVLVTGGLIRGAPGQGFPPATSAEVYDPRTGAWSAAGAMGAARASHTASRLEGPACSGGPPPSWCGKVLVAGGSASAPAELYDPVTRTFASTGTLATPRVGHTAAVLLDGRVLVAGGRLVNPNGQLGDPLATAEVYDPASGLWTVTPVAPAEPRSSHTATRLPDGRVLLAGGVGVGLAAVGPAEVYDPGTGSWSSAGSLVVPRSQHSASLLPDGRVLLAGGEDAFGAFRRTSEIFVPAAGQWIALGTMVTARARHTATVRPDGSVVVAGGTGIGPTGSGADLAAGELFRGGAWSGTGPLLGARQRHSATLLEGTACGGSCGRVLVTGGIRPSVPALLASSELLVPVTPTYPLPASSGRVGDLSARALSARRVRLTFSAPGWPPRGGRPAGRYLIKQARRPFNPASFERSRSLCGGSCRFAPGRIGDRITLTVTGLVPNRRYHYGLVALDSAGNRGPVSNYARVRTRRDRIRPGRVRDRTARAGSTRVRLRFRAPASDGRRGPPVRRYLVKQSPAPIRGARRFRRARSLCRGSCRFAPRRVGARLTLTVRGLCPGRRYHFAIRAKDEGGNLSRVSRFRPIRTKRRGPARERCSAR